MARVAPELINNKIIIHHEDKQNEHRKGGKLNWEKTEQSAAKRAKLLYKYNCKNNNN